MLISELGTCYNMMTDVLVKLENTYISQFLYGVSV